MTRSASAVMAILATGTLFAQPRTAPSRYGNASGFGSVLFPGTGHAPRVVQPMGRITGPPRVAHPGHNRRSVVAVPVYVGGYGYGYGYDLGAPAPVMAPGYEQPMMAPQQVTPPVVIINQGYQPQVANPLVREYNELPEPTLRTYDAPIHPVPDPGEVRRQPVEEAKATIYLIAFKDHTILPALAYWVDGDTLNYVTQNGTPNRASLELIDREFSKQLNRERKVEFALP